MFCDVFSANVTNLKRRKSKQEQSQTTLRQEEMMTKLTYFRFLGTFTFAQPSAESTIDCDNTEIENFQSLCSNTTLQCRICTSEWAFTSLYSAALLIKTYLVWTSRSHSLACSCSCNAKNHPYFFLWIEWKNWRWWLATNTQEKMLWKPTKETPLDR